ncbi:hypothetical protein GCM10027298_32360 [Epidermidibacterium keratini]
MRDVASRAGMALSNLYNYYPSKAVLVARLLELTNNDLLGRIRSAVDEAGASPTDQLRAAIEAYVGFNVDQPNASVVGISEIRYLTGQERQSVIAARDATEQIFKQILRVGVDRGEFETPYPDDIPRNMIAMMAGMAIWYRPDGALDREAITQRQVRLCLAMVEARD